MKVSIRKKDILFISKYLSMFICDTTESGGGRFPSSCLDVMADTTKWNCLNSLNYTSPSSSLSQHAFCQMWWSSLGIFDPAMTKYLNLLHFRPERGVSVCFEDKQPRVGSVHNAFVMAQDINDENIIVKKSAKTSREVDLAPGLTVFVKQAGYSN